MGYWKDSLDHLPVLYADEHSFHVLGKVLIRPEAFGLCIPVYQASSMDEHIDRQAFQRVRRWGDDVQVQAVFRTKEFYREAMAPWL